MSWRSVVGFGLLVIAASGAAETPEDRAAKKPVPLYTNEDLDRVSVHRDETGVSSRPETPAAPAAGAASSGRAAEEGRARSEAYWRRQAERVHDRLQRARDRKEDLRARIAARESQPASRTRRTPAATDAQLETWRRQLASLEERIREEEARFEDRARREGALPGWIR